MKVKLNLGGTARRAILVTALSTVLAWTLASGAQAVDVTTKIRLYADASSKTNKDDATGIKSTDSGSGIDVKRAYLTIDAKFDDVYSAEFQSDIGDQGARRYDVFVKKAFIQAKFSPMATFRLGAADTPWVPFVEGLYGKRYIETVITDHLSFGTSSEWGLHYLGQAGILSYQLTVGNGKGYSNPTRTKSVDFEGRLSVQPIDGLTVAVGGYSGKRGNDTDATPAKHTASRTDALVSYKVPTFNVGGEWFSADNWNNTTSVAKDKADGYSVWGGVPFAERYEAFARYDTANPSKTLKPKLEFTYYNAGLQYTINSTLLAAVVYKYAEVKGGTVGTSNGTIGSTNALSKGKYNEIGAFFQFNF